MYQIPDYNDGKNVLDVVDYMVYNDLAAAVVEGDCYFLSYERDADSLTTPARPTLEAMATSATIKRKIVVALENVADGAWGRFRYKGLCEKVLCDSAVAIDDYLIGTDASKTAANGTSTMVAGAFGICVLGESATDGTGFCKAILFGRETIIAAV